MRFVQEFRRRMAQLRRAGDALLSRRRARTARRPHERFTSGALSELDRLRHSGAI